MVHPHVVLGIPQGLGRLLLVSLLAEGQRQVVGGGHVAGLLQMGVLEVDFGGLEVFLPQVNDPAEHLGLEGGGIESEGLTRLLLGVLQLRGKAAKIPLRHRQTRGEIVGVLLQGPLKPFLGIAVVLRADLFGVAPDLLIELGQPGFRGEHVLLVDLEGSSQIGQAAGGIAQSELARASRW